MGPNSSENLSWHRLLATAFRSAISPRSFGFGSRSLNFTEGSFSVLNGIWRVSPCVEAIIWFSYSLSRPEGWQSENSELAFEFGVFGFALGLLLRVLYLASQQKEPLLELGCRLRCKRFALADFSLKDVGLEKVCFPRFRNKEGKAFWVARGPLGERQMGSLRAFAEVPAEASPFFWLTRGRA